MQLLRPVCWALMAAGTVAAADDKTPGDMVIEEAIKLLEAKGEKLEDALDRGKVDKAIRELEAMIGVVKPEPTPTPPAPPAPPQPPLQVDIELLRKRFGASKATYSPKTGVIKLEYGFSGGKGELADFDIGQKRVLQARKSLAVEAGDEIKHIAKWKTVTVEATISGKTLNGAGIGTSTGALLTARNGTAVLITGAKPVSKPIRFRPAVPVAFDVNAEKVSGKYGTEVLAAPFTSDETHQVTLRGGSDGCAFGELVISGVPDPVWLKGFLEAQ